MHSLEFLNAEEPIRQNPDSHGPWAGASAQSTTATDCASMALRCGETLKPREDLWPQSLAAPSDIVSPCMPKDVIREASLSVRRERDTLPPLSFRTSDPRCG
jgi:hypothetical protein